MKNHGFWMAIGCGLPLLLLFILTSFGVSNQVTFVTFIVLMLACHLFMPHEHGHNQSSNNQGDTGHEIIHRH